MEYDPFVIDSALCVFRIDNRGNTYNRLVGYLGGMLQCTGFGILSYCLPLRGAKLPRVNFVASRPYLSTKKILFFHVIVEIYSMVIMFYCGFILLQISFFQRRMHFDNFDNDLQ